VISTELDKAWVRAATAKLIRQGKLMQRPCDICGARETLVHHIDYSDPEHIKWLCKRHKSEEQLSPLQRSLLKRGLAAWHTKALAIDCQVCAPDSFKSGSMITNFEDRRERASRRAAAGLSIERLIKRGLLERCARGSWRLTPTGLRVARGLYPDLKPPTKRRLAHGIALRKPLSVCQDALPESLDVFVLMPFKTDLLPVYQDHIKPTCTKLKLTVRRGHDFFTADSVIHDIWNAIANARLIVADCTDRNPNVFYEIGVAHTIGKETILITQKSEDVPFDLRHLRYIPYQLTPRGMKQFEEAFEETIRNVLDIPPSAK
jgi:hypothetical protein